MTKPAWWWAGKQICKAHEDLKYVHKRATSSAPTQSLPWWMCTRKMHSKAYERTQRQPRSRARVLSITLLTHIRFLKSLRSTASPILSHFHTLLHHTLSLTHTQFPLQRLEPIPVKHSIFYQTLPSQSSLRTLSSHNFQLLVWSNPSTAFVVQVSITIQWPCDLHKYGPKEQSATLQGPST